MKEYTIIRGKKPVGVISLEGKTVLGLLQALKAERAIIKDFGAFGTIQVYGVYTNSANLEKDSVLPDMCNDELFINQYSYMAFFKSL